MISSSRSMRNNTCRAAQTGASCVATNMDLRGGRALCVRLFILSVLAVIRGLLLILLSSLLITRFKLVPLRIS